MLKSLICFSLFFITLIQCGTIDVQFPTFPTDTDIGSCTCDLTVGQCDASCCCDRDCDSEDKKAFACDSRDNQFTNSTIVLSTVQPTCFKNISIFHSNSPYIIQKMGELVCVDFERYKGSQYYKQPINQIIDTSRFLSEINSDYAVLPAYSIPSDQTNYQVGTPILRNASTTNEQIFSLPSTLFDNNLCSASRSITYMNDFTSTCTQPVTSTTCTDVLDPRTYFNRLCFRQSPGNAVIICANIPTFTTPAFNSPSCSNALTSLTITVYYSNPTGITNVTATRTIANVTGTVQQTFTVLFRKIESVQSIGSPGYREGNVIQVGTATNSTISLTDSSLFNTYEPSTSGSCSGSLTVPVRFGESVQSTCKFTGTCSQLLDQLSPSDITNLYVAAYANSSLSNFTRDWLPIKIYKSDINYPELQESVASYSTLNVSGTCYTRLHVQVAYTNIGSIKNPQSVLSAVIFHYQYIRNSITTSITTILTKSITFQEIQNTPVVEQGRIPAPNTRLPENFFYPFSGNSATRSMTFSFEFYSFLCFYLASRMIYLI